MMPIKTLKMKKKLIKVFVIYTDVLEGGEEFEEGFAEEAPLHNRLEISGFYFFYVSLQIHSFPEVCR
jgi:hypothetical protein